MTLSAPASIVSFDIGTLLQKRSAYLNKAKRAADLLEKPWAAARTPPQEGREGPATNAGRGPGPTPTEQSLGSPHPPQPSALRPPTRHRCPSTTLSPIARPHGFVSAHPQRVPRHAARARALPSYASGECLRAPRDLGTLAARVRFWLAGHAKRKVDLRHIGNRRGGVS
jgi:hypothetical protein